MKIVLARAHGMCFGVRDAITLARGEAARGPLTVLGALVHNPDVDRDLRAQGVAIERDPERAAPGRAMITAHGASDRFRARARRAGLEVLDATCPLVARAHRMIQEAVRLGEHVVLLGVPGHVEVVGLTEDLAEHDLVTAPGDVARIPFHPRFAVAAQTTQPSQRLASVATALRERHPGARVRLLDTVCQPTRDRQDAAVELAQRCSVVVVVGGCDSNNTAELAATCARFCGRVHRVTCAADIRREWFRDADLCGVTAGTSTPDGVVDGVMSRLRELADARAGGADQDSSRLSTKASGSNGRRSSAVSPTPVYRIGNPSS